MSPDRQVRLVPLPNSDHPAPRNCRHVGKTSPTQQITVTVILKRAQPLDIAGLKGRQLSREEYLNTHGATAQAIEQVRTLAARHGLTLVHEDRAARRVWLRGTAQQLEQTFGVQLNDYEYTAPPPSGRYFHALTGKVSVPEPESGVIETVLGLDTRPIARPHIRWLSQIVFANPNAAQASFTPPQVAKAYDYPTGVNGPASASRSSNSAAVTKLPISKPTLASSASRRPRSSPYLSMAAQTRPAIPTAPTAKSRSTSRSPDRSRPARASPSTSRPTPIRDFRTPSPPPSTTPPTSPPPSPSPGAARSPRGTRHRSPVSTTRFPVRRRARHHDHGRVGRLRLQRRRLRRRQPRRLSRLQPARAGLRWHRPHCFQRHAALPKPCGTINRRAAARPAAVSPATLPCHPGNPERKFPRHPDGSGGRGVPDVSGDAAPATGYQILVDGQSAVVGGTSAVAPLWAALIALVNQQTGRNAGFLNPDALLRR